jgi:hypothetical protein
MEVQTLAQMKARYPDEWVLVGSPDLGGEKALGTIINKLVSGNVLYHTKDKHEVAYNGKEPRKGYENLTLIYTGEIPKKRKFWL